VKGSKRFFFQFLFFIFLILSSVCWFCASVIIFCSRLFFYFLIFIFIFSLKGKSKKKKKKIKRNPSRTVYFEKIRVFQAGIKNRFEYISME